MNEKIDDAKKKKKHNRRSEFEFCIVCKLNHDDGQRHKYFPSHKKSLSAFLCRFQDKLADVKFFLKYPTVLRPEHASRNRLWCVFCDVDIDETGSFFACANAINHLASMDHLKKLKHSMWKFGGEMDLVDTFRILEADLAKWEKKLEALKDGAASSGDGSCGLQVGPSNDIHNELNHGNINNFENNTFDPLKSNLLNGVMPLHYYTNENQISHSGSSAVTNVGPFVHTISSLPADASSSACLWNSNDLTGNWNGQHPITCDSTPCSHNISNGGVYQGGGTVKEVSSTQGLQTITQICTMASQKAAGNVHTGALPPWFEAAEEGQLNIQKPFSSRFVSLTNKPGKSKLNPKRVGAAWAERRKIELEMEKRGEIVKSDCDDNWLPNFGRVWQSGSRKESRKEFEREKRKLPKVESHPEVSVTIQPYVSKRMRRDASNDS